MREATPAPAKKKSGGKKKAWPWVVGIVAVVGVVVLIVVLMWRGKTKQKEQLEAMPPENAEGNAAALKPIVALDPPPTPELFDGNNPLTEPIKGHAYAVKKNDNPWSICRRAGFVANTMLAVKAMCNDPANAWIGRYQGKPMTLDLVQRFKPQVGAEGKPYAYLTEKSVPSIGHKWPVARVPADEDVQG